MALYKPRTQFGFHSASFFNKTTGIPYGICKVVQSYSPSFSREAIDLFGGSNPNAIDTSDGQIDNSLTLTVKEFKPFLFELAGYTVTTNVVDNTSGTVLTALTNGVGTSVEDASNGVSSVSISDEDVVADGRYILVATGAQAADLYLSTDINFDVGGNLEYLTDTLKVASALDLSSTLVDTDTGITFTVTGTSNFTTGDTAYFDILGPNEGYNVYTLDSNPTPVEFELFLYSQRKSNGEFFADHYPRVRFNSVPAGMTEQEWLTAELSCKVLYDNTLGYASRRIDKIKDLT